MTTANQSCHFAYRLSSPRRGIIDHCPTPLQHQRTTKPRQRRTQCLHAGAAPASCARAPDSPRTQTGSRIAPIFPEPARQSDSASPIVSHHPSSSWVYPARSAQPIQVSMSTGRFPAPSTPGARADAETRPVQHLRSPSTVVTPALPRSTHRRRRRASTHCHCAPSPLASAPSCFIVEALLVRIGRR